MQHNHDAGEVFSITSMCTSCRAEHRSFVKVAATANNESVLEEWSIVAQVKVVESAVLES